jgi:hypothetical protein
MSYFTGTDRPVPVTQTYFIRQITIHYTGTIHINSLKNSISKKIAQNGHLISPGFITGIFL